jgi:hypothetical protein
VVTIFDREVGGEIVATLIRLDVPRMHLGKETHWQHGGYAEGEKPPSADAVLVQELQACVQQPRLRHKGDDLVEDFDGILVAAQVGRGTSRVTDRF